MSLIEIKKIGITQLDTDAVVNAANTGLGKAAEYAVSFFAMPVPRK